MSAKKIGDLIEAGKVPPELARFGTTKEELFSDLPELRGLYGSAADGFSTGAVGVYSYLNRIAYGLRHFAAPEQEIRREAHRAARRLPAHPRCQGTA